MSPDKVSGRTTGELRARLGEVAPQLRVLELESVASTNSALLQQAQSGALQPTLMVAAEQTAGRGRLGRHWFSGTRGQALTFSLGLVLAPRDWSGLSLVVGLVLAQALHPQIRLKWPNDLLWQGRKLGGILIETCAPPPLASGRYVVIGVGINQTLPPALEGDMRPACLREIGSEAPQEDLLCSIVPVLLHALGDFARDGFAPWRDRYAERDALCGLEIAISDGRCGQALGVAEDGSLRLHTAAGEVSVRGGELSVRPHRVAAPTS